MRVTPLNVGRVHKISIPFIGEGTHQVNEKIKIQAQLINAKIDDLPSNYY